MKKRNPKRKKIRFLPYAVELCVIAVVVAAAFFLPQIIFGVQDNLLWGDTSLGQRESMNVESLGTTYEVSLGKRMQKFVDGLTENQNFYLTSQELTANDTLRNYLYSEKGLYWDLIIRFVDDSLIPSEIWTESSDWGYSVSQWKQYVIYSDNYEEGVNFILWYIEMQDSDGGIFKLLADAEDGTIYGLKTEGSSRLGSSFGYDYLRGMIRYGESAVEAWSYYAMYYEAITDDLQSAVSLAEKMGVDVGTIQREFDAMDAELSAFRQEEIKMQFRELFQYRLETKDRTCFFIPFGESALDAVVEVQDQEYRNGILFPDVTMGIRQIYELIPEFA